MAIETIRTAPAAETTGLEPSPTRTPAGGRWSHTFDSLSDRSYRWFFFSMASWFAAMNMSQLVNGFIVYQLTGSYTALGLVSLASAIPMLLLSLPGGVIADRFVKQKVIQIGQVVNMLTAGGLAALMLSGVLVFEHLLISAAAQGIIFGLILPSRQTMIADVVSPNRLSNGIALNSAGQNIMRLTAPPIGGVLLTVIGAGWVYLTMTVLYGLSALCMLPVRARADADRSSLRKTSTDGQRNLGFRDMLDGCRYIWRDKTVLLILATNSVVVLLAMPIQQMLPGFVTDVLDADGIGLGIIMSLIGLGSVIGSLGLATMSDHKRGIMLMGSAVILGVSLFAFALSSVIWFSAIMAVILGIGQAGRISVSSVLIQTYTQAEYRGRVMSVYMMQFSFVSLGTFAIGLMAGAFGVQVALAINGAVLLAFALITLVAMPAMRKLD